MGFLLHCAPAFAFDWADYSSSALVESTRGTEIFTCTGVAISRKVVLTAAHCVHGTDSVRVSLDAVYQPKSGVFYAVAADSTSIHPAYDSSVSLFGHDLAAIFLSEKLPRSIKILPILPTRSLIPDGTMLEKVGYGSRDGVNQRTWSSVGFQKDESGNLFTQDSLSVPGDSGGPLFYRSGTSLWLVAVHSTLITEGDTKSAAAVDLGKNIQWLEQTTGLRLH